MPKLTKALVEGVRIPERRETFLWDSELRGFGVRVMPTGLKTFILQYRNAEGRGRRLSIGRYGVFTVEEARAEARILLGEVARGRDPMQMRQDTRSAPTVADICDWYLAEAEAGHLLGRSRRPIKASSLRMDRSRIERHIKPLIGRRQVRSLRTPDIERLQADIAAGATAMVRTSGRGRTTSGGLGAASRSISTLHSLFEHAVRMGQIESNPARGVRRMASERRTRRLSSAEYIALGRAMRQAAKQGEDPVGLAAVRFLLLTGFRLNEAQKLEWSWVDTDSFAVRFPDTKSGAQNRPIGAPALNLIHAQPKVDGNPYVFTSHWCNDHYKQVPDVITRLCCIARLENVTAHVFRHSLASAAGDLGFSDITIAGLLGHGARGVTQGYIHIDEGLRIAVEKVSKRIADLLDGSVSNIRDADIVPISKPVAASPPPPVKRVRSWREVRSMRSP